ncbi:MAG: SDR family oxidoreductase [Chloroflexi bacterium]|nr:SDR family oxidoreductase [Chloroflexota bacterium]MDA1145835.1 SDR family oxidoreductase [Chloroflexota bacterium]
MPNPPPPDRGPVYESLRDKRAVISGGSRGIGRAIALRLAREGAHVAVTYARSAAAADETAEACRALGVEATAWKADVGNEDEVRALFHHLEGWSPGGGAPGIDIFINNAARGLERPRPALQQRQGHLHRAMDVNVFGPWLAVQLAAPLIESRGGGTVVNLLSPGATHYMKDYAAVGVSKAALSSLTMYLAVELASLGIRVNAVSAGWVEGSEGDRTYQVDVANKVRPHVPAGRNVAPEDIAATVAWLCSDEAPMLVGQTVYLDGGFADAAWRGLMEESSIPL